MGRWMGILVGVSLCCVLTTGVQADVIDVDSTISDVTVYPASARVTREVRVALKEGEHTLRLKDIKPMLDENSFMVSGQGTASVKIFGAGFRSEYLTVSPDERVRELEEKIQKVSDDIAGVQGEFVVLEQKGEFLKSVKVFSGEQIPKDLVTKMPPTTDLQAVLGFLGTELQSVQDARQKLTIQIRELSKTKDALNRELAQVRSSPQREQRSIVVDVECDKAGDLNLEVSYNVPQATWSAVYDARVAFEKSQAVLSAFAVVRQTTGEDWTNVRLTVSTARPAVGGRMPELSPWYLRPYEVPRQRGMFMNALAGRMKSATDDIGDQYSAENMPKAESAPEKKRAEVVYAQSMTTGAALVYKLPRPVTVKSDGSDARAPLMSQTLAVKFQYSATPKLSPYAYLRSVVTNGKEDQLLPGRINIFLDGNYVGASDIAKTVAPEEEFDLYLGVDEGVTVRRELLDEKSDDTLIGSIPSPTRRISYKYKLTVENYKPREVTVNLFDQVPVAQDDKIKIERAEASVKPVTDKYKDRVGVYQWALTLKTKEKREIILSYTVAYPRDLNIEGL